MDQNILNTLAAKRLSEMSEDEMVQVKSWANSEEISNFLDDLQFIEENSKEISEYQSFSPNNFDPSSETKSYRGLYLASAAILIIALLSFLVSKIDKFSFNNASNQEIQIAFLPDHSEVKLFGDASIDFSSNFNQENRVVQLDGTAFFDISHNPAKPFIIQHEEIQIEVLGTSFLVSENNGIFGVDVRDGKVLVESKNGNKIILTKNEAIRIENSEFSNILDSKSFNYLFSGQFKHVSARNIMIDIAQKNNLDLSFESENILAQCFFNGSFHNASIIEVLEEFKLLFGLEFQIGRKSLQLKDSSCS